MNYFFFALLFACSIYAFVAGGGPERVGAAVYAASCVASFLVYSAVPVRFQGVEVGVFIVDILVFLAFVLLALRANRFWTIWVSALLGLGVVGHLAMLLRPQVIPWAYAVVLSIWSYPILLMIVLGTVAHRRRMIRNGADPSWTRSSDLPGQPKRPFGPTP
ncbi:MAG: hypothetical protein ACT4N8_09155 [Sphingosinicella sp.]|uniref:hypothetical protein n=1 Tax=Sphingosinicella sp. TaxID=1917971 RepID=UPI004037B93B